MTFTFPNRPLRTSVIRTQSNPELIERVRRIKAAGVQETIRVTSATL